MFFPTFASNSLPLWIGVFVKLNYDNWLRWGMSPAFLRDPRQPKRQGLGQEENAAVPVWIMCLTDVNHMEEI